MDSGPLVNEQVDAGARFIREFAKYTPLEAAFWLKAADDNEWFLYIAGDQIDDSNFDLAYAEVIRITSTVADPWLDPFQIKVIGADDPLSKAVIEIQKKYPAALPTRYHGPQLGGLSIVEAYIYSLPIPVPV